MARVSRDHIDKFFEYGLDIDNRTIYLGSMGTDIDGEEAGVDHEMAEYFLKALYLLERSSTEKPITIIMNNPGGDCYQGMAIYDAIKRSNAHITIRVYGNATSMGCIILQAADVRQLAPHSCVMFHEGYDGYPTNHPEIIRRWVEYNKRFGSKLDAIIYNKIAEKHPEFKQRKFKEMNVFDTILSAEEAVELGLADSILQ